MLLMTESYAFDVTNDASTSIKACFSSFERSIFVQENVVFEFPNSFFCFFRCRKLIRKMVYYCHLSLHFFLSVTVLEHRRMQTIAQLFGIFPSRLRTTLCNNN